MKTDVIWTVSWETDLGMGITGGRFRSVEFPELRWPGWGVSAGPLAMAFAQGLRGDKRFRNVRVTQSRLTRSTEEVA